MTCDITYLELAELQTAKPSDRLEKHIAQCESCRRRLESLKKVDNALRSIPRESLCDQAALTIRQNLAKEIRGSDVHEIMTLTDVADFLRLSPEQFEEILGELPAFELAGQIRVRRTRLIAWIEQREREYYRTAVESEMARSVSRFPTKGVA